MSSFQRLIAIPQEEYSSMMNVQKQELNPLSQQMQNLDQQIKQGENSSDPYRQLVLQSNALDRMIHLKEQMRESVSISTPKPYLNRAKALFRNMEAFLKFNDKGEIITNDDKTIPQSRIEDLVQHAVRDRRRNMTPTGWDYFLRLLKEHNIPKSLLNRPTLDEIEGIQAPVETKVIKTESKATPSRIPVLDRSISRVKQTPAKVRTQPPRDKKPDIEFLKEY